MSKLTKKLFLLVLAISTLGIQPTHAAAPAAPTNVTVSNASLANTATNAAKANVSWTPVSGAIAYYVNATSGGTTITKPVPGANTSSFVFEDLSLILVVNLKSA